MLSLCNDVLIPNLTSPDVEKSFAFTVREHFNFDTTIRILFTRIFDSLIFLYKRHKGFQGSETYVVIATCLHLMSGGGDGKQYRLKSPRPIEASFRQIRDIAVTSLGIYGKIREMLFHFVTPLMSVFEEEDYRSVSIYRSSPEMSFVVDTMFKLCIFLCECDDEAYNVRLGYLCREVLTIPIIASFLTESAAKEFLASRVFDNAMLFFTQRTLALPPSQHSVFQSGHFLLGNFCSLAVGVACSTTHVAVRLTTLIQYS